MTRGSLRRRLALEWWLLLAAALAPLSLLGLFFGAATPGWPALHMPLFIAGLLSMFVSLRPFGHYKRQLVATQASLDSPAEPDAWLNLARVRRRGLLAAALPAWIAALALLGGLNAVALILLALASVVICSLYRIPPQLG
ncbi:MFS transporter [Pseudomonas sp. N040]|uniref:MFS transporter n=1 Tax=Pseudomonas sp. N040 TaxID=2785325 RepID=UPI0018A32C5B|nr:MFS transporter [Pseudomonas sp. N040]MBF7730911.1 MFS transporter [Pseudomonas sp. N040]MBW7014554.1 MFS transporter [Pseudomonas sp. N040]